MRKRARAGPRRQSFLLFQSFKIDQSFLAKDPSAWAEVGYQRLSKFVKNLKVVNVVAEHAIQLQPAPVKGAQPSSDRSEFWRNSKS